MFDIGWSEMAVIMLVALVVIGPKDLPRLARTVGQWVAKGRSMAREFQRSLEEMAREADLDDVKREIEKVGRTDLRRSIEKTIDPTGELGRAFDPNSRPNSRKAPSKATSAAAANGQAANGQAEETPAKAEAVGRQDPAPQTETKTRASTARPKARTKPKSAATTDTKAAAGAASKAKAAPRSAAKPKTAPKAAPKTTSNTTSAESTETETMAEPS